MITIYPRRERIDPKADIARLVDHLRRLFSSSGGTVNVSSAGTTQVSVLRPDLANPVVLTASTVVWTVGAYSQMAASADLAAHALTGIYFDGDLASNNTQIEIAQGAAGAEVVIYRFSPREFSEVGVDPFIPVPIPVQITANLRVAARFADSAAVAGGALVRLKLQFTPRPL